MSILKNVYFVLVYPYLQYSVMTWVNTTAICLDKIQTQQNYLIKIISNAPLIKPKLSPLYEQLHLLKLRKWLFCLHRQNSIFPCLGKGWGKG